MIMLNGKDSFWLQLEVCREYQRSRCTRSDGECKFAHPPTNVEIQSNGRVTACYDSIKGRCQRESCKYMHPPAHLKDQLLINGRNHLALKNALIQQQQQHFQDPHSQQPQLKQHQQHHQHQHQQQQHQHQQQQQQQQQAALFQSAVAAAAVHHQQQLNPHNSTLAHHNLKPASSYDLSMQAHPAAAIAAVIAASSMNPFMTPGAFTHTYANQYAAAVAAAAAAAAASSSQQQLSPRVPTFASASPKCVAQSAAPGASQANPAEPPAAQTSNGLRTSKPAPAKQAGPGTIKAPPTHYPTPASGTAPDPLAAYYMAPAASALAAVAAMLGQQPSSANYAPPANYTPANNTQNHYQSVLSACLYPARTHYQTPPLTEYAQNGLTQSCDKKADSNECWVPNLGDKKRVKSVDIGEHNKQVAEPEVSEQNGTPKDEAAKSASCQQEQEEEEQLEPNNKRPHLDLVQTPEAEVTPANASSTTSGEKVSSDSTKKNGTCILSPIYNVN